MKYKGYYVPLPDRNQEGNAGFPFICHNASLDCRKEGDCNTCLLDPIGGYEEVKERILPWYKGKSKSRKEWEGMFNE